MKLMRDTTNVRLGWASLETMSMVEKVDMAEPAYYEAIK